ncbi:hypothetical protein PP182_02560 [Maribacter sp. PR1]|uniref:Uncharacterized protein n=1 Tax=Maribacter cobaltidurans TaxID=1178778 RepID=A0ABU7IQ45_9FLAO|nr:MULTISPECIES: hypothetical protein [Maribacter]MDC6387548.1 hypothetical protein [Maribacter sp. PR1]MEE1974936.1 hypothetical protein [Maribacter cobaltidurans]
MKQRLLKYIVPVVLTLLCGLTFVHSNLEIDESSVSNSNAVLSSLDNQEHHAQLDSFSISSNRKVALEIAETEEQEEEIRHSFLDQSKQFGNSLGRYLHDQFLEYFLNPTKVSHANLKNLATVLPYSRYICYQVFRL